MTAVIALPLKLMIQHKMFIRPYNIPFYLLRSQFCAKNNSGDENITGNISSTGHDRSNTTTECGIFQQFRYHNKKLFKMYA